MRSLRFLLIGPVLLAAAACGTDRSTGVANASAVQTPSYSAVKFWEAGATVAWNELANDLAARRVIDAGRFYAYLGMAQFRAAQAAQTTPGPHPPVAAAIGGASVAVLRSFFPLDVAEIEAALDAQGSAPAWPGAKHADFADGEALGRAVGAAVIAYAQGDGIGLTNPLLPPFGPPPVTPGSWLYSGGPIARGALGARPIFLSSRSQIRPPAPPAFGSAEFLSALAEVRQIANNRTPEQLAIANFWNVNQSPRSDAAIMRIARDLIVSHRRSDTEAARIMFLMGASAFDALIGCFDAKYFYWYIRPPQADPTIVTAFATPPHPSYPSAHSCASGAFAAVLSEAFPSERAAMDAIAQEASLSRLYAGIHYRFDMDAGLALGRAAAAIALAADISGPGQVP